MATETSVWQNMLGGAILLVVGIAIGGIATYGIQQEEISKLKNAQKSYTRNLNVMVRTRDALPIDVSLKIEFTKGRYSTQNTIADIRRMVHTTFAPRNCTERAEAAAEIMKWRHNNFRVVQVIADDNKQCRVK